MSTHTLVIARWHPRRLNELLGCHWTKAARLKKADRQMIAGCALRDRIPRAAGKRRLSVLIRLRPRQRGGDPDCYWKSLCDALKHAGLLRDDNRQWVELVPVRYERGTADDWGTEITLEDC